MTYCYILYYRIYNIYPSYKLLIHNKMINDLFLIF